MKFDVCFEKIRSIVEEMACSMVVSFYPESIRRKSDLPMIQVIQELEKLEENGYIEKKFNVICPLDFHTVELVCSVEEILGQTITCDTCGEEFEISEDNLYPEYYFTREYLQFVENQKKKQTRHIKQVMVV